MCIYIYIYVYIYICIYIYIRIYIYTPADPFTCQPWHQQRRRRQSTVDLVLRQEFHKDLRIQGGLAKPTEIWPKEETFPPQKKRYVLELSKETEMVLDGFFVTFFGGRPEALRDFVVFIVVLNSWWVVDFFQHGNLWEIETNFWCSPKVWVNDYIYIYHRQFCDCDLF